MTPPLWTEATLGTLRGVAEAAGAAIMSVYARGGDVAVQRKEDNSPLTEADLLADRLILARLAIMFSGTPVVTEETPPPPGTDLSAGFFLVDPLDGTREFLARNGEFTVNIAWISQGRPVAGVVHSPALGETHWGAAGVGAWRHSAAGIQGLAAAPPAPGQPWRVVASRSHLNAADQAWLERLPPPCEVVNAGSSLKFCRVADHAADLYLRSSPTMAWDTAAGQAVLEAAGGVVLGLDGRPLTVPANIAGQPNTGFVAAATAVMALAALRARLGPQAE